ncbi:MAG: hypothetical protein COA70_06465 [Planctomycetota bacterium]|nr:MAG: hypothetical protein COA70_06465 [Planctomycetota bacterium]
MALKELRRIAPLYRRYRKRYILGVTALIGAVVLRISVPYLLGRTVDVLRTAAEEPAAGGVDAASLTGLAMQGGLWIAAVAFMGAVLRTVSRLFVLGNSRRGIHDLRNQVLGHLVKLSPSYYGKNSTGMLMSRCVNDVQFVQSLMGPVFLYLAETAALYVVALSYMGSIDIRLTGLAILPFPFFLIRARRLATKIQIDSRASQEALGEVSAKVEESLSGGMVVRSLALEDFDLDRFRRRCTTYRDINLRLTGQRAWMGVNMNLLGSTSTLIVLLVGGPMAARGTISLGDFVAMVFYLNMLAAPTGVLGFVISSLQRGTAALRRVGEILDVEPSLEQGREVDLGQGEIAIKDLTIVLENAKGEPRTVLDQVNIDIPSGSVLGVVGATGSGKSILLRALARQLEVEENTVFFGGKDAHAYRLKELREQIGYVPQEAFLFSMSLAENVALGRPGASAEEIADAIKASRLEQDLVQLPEGYDTLVGERGLNLSGGQRQRTALARVLLLRPKVLLLDDPFSAVDASTTDEILKGLKGFFAECTTVLVAHRVATVQHADHIVVMEEGRIIERGNHAELLQQQGAYAALYQRQQERASLREELGEEPLG